MRDGRTPIHVRTYDFLLWLLPHTARFPKAMRHSVTNRLEGAALDLQAALLLANRRRGRGRLDAVRLLVLLAAGFGWLSGRQYEFATEKLAEIGRLIGGWRKATPPDGK